MYLYAGPYKPKPHVDPGHGGRLYQNFTVYIPTFLSKGRAQLNVALAGFIGVGFLQSLVNAIIDYIG